MLSVLRGENNTEKITALYKKMLLNQFHDILPGSHIHPVYEDAMRDYAEVEAGLDEIIGTGGKYFNTLNFKRDALTFVENPRGDSVRCGKKGNWIVPNMPALSSASLRKAAAKADWFSVSGNKIKTPYYSADLNDDGSFASLFDKKRSREWVKGEFNKLKIFDDRPGNYDAWDILPNYREKEINTELAEKLEFLGATGECAEFTVTHKTENPPGAE